MRRDFGNGFVLFALAPWLVVAAWSIASCTKEQTAAVDRSIGVASKAIHVAAEACRELVDEKHTPDVAVLACKRDEQLDEVLVTMPRVQWQAIGDAGWLPLPEGVMP